MEVIAQAITEMNVLLKTIASTMAEDALLVKQGAEAKTRMLIHKRERSAVTSRLNELKWEWMELNWAEMPEEEA